MTESVKLFTKVITFYLLKVYHKLSCLFVSKFPRIMVLFEIIVISAVAKLHIITVLFKRSSLTRNEIVGLFLKYIYIYIYIASLFTFVEKIMIANLVLYYFSTTVSFRSFTWKQ